MVLVYSSQHHHNHYHHQYQQHHLQMDSFSVNSDDDSSYMEEETSHTSESAPAVPECCDFEWEPLSVRGLDHTAVSHPGMTGSIPPSPSAIPLTSAHNNYYPMSYANHSNTTAGDAQRLMMMAAEQQQARTMGATRRDSLRTPSDMLLQHSMAMVPPSPSLPDRAWSYHSAPVLTSPISLSSNSSAHTLHALHNTNNHMAHNNPNNAISNRANHHFDFSSTQLLHNSNQHQIYAHPQTVSTSELQGLLGFSSPASHNNGAGRETLTQNSVHSLPNIPLISPPATPPENRSCTTHSTRPPAADFPTHTTHTTKYNNGSSPVYQNRNLQSEQWDKLFKDLREYALEHGDCLVPHKYEKNPQLAQWVKRQRYQYKLKQKNFRSTISEERQQLLNSLNFVWDTHQAAWTEKYQSLMEYKSVHGHVSVPSSTSSHNKDANHRPLAIWVKCQRRQFKLFMQGKQSSMTRERIHLLEAVHFDWNPRRLNLPTSASGSSSGAAATSGAGAVPL